MKYSDMNCEDINKIQKNIIDFKDKENKLIVEKIGTLKIDLEKFTNWYINNSYSYFMNTIPEYYNNYNKQALNDYLSLSDEDKLKYQEKYMKSLWERFLCNLNFNDFNLSSYQSTLFISKDQIQEYVDNYYKYLKGTYHTFKEYKNIFNNNIEKNIVLSWHLTDFLKTQLYLSKIDLKWNIFYKDSTCIIVKFNQTLLVIPPENDFISDIEYYKNYNETIIEQLSISSLNDSPINNSLIASNTELSKLSKKDIENNINNISEIMKQAYNYETPDLKPLYDEIEQKKAELQKQEENLRALMYEKQYELQLKLEELKKELFLLDTQIYTIRCFMNECINFIQLRSGKRSNIEHPITLFQKLRFLDEEFGKLDATDQIDFTQYDLVETAIKTNDEIFECLCQNDKCISLIKVSKNNKSVGLNNNDLLTNYKYFHGSQLAILIRDGENLYMGWCDEDRITISDDVFVSNSSSENSTVENVASRLFIFTILKGAMQNSNMIELPISVKDDISFTKPSKYVLFSSADNQIIDETYLPLSEIISGLNSINKEKDDILLIRKIFDGRYSSYSRTYEYERGIGYYNNRTHDAKLSNGIHKINLIIDQKNINRFPDYNEGIYVSAKKEYSECNARANMMIYKEEFINLTYLNSLIIKYFIDTKRIGNFHIESASFDYAHMIKYLKQAKLYLEDKEEKEANIFENNLKYPIKSIDNWQNYISSFKLLKKVRSITEYQAKRFLRWYFNLSDKEKKIYSKYLIINDISN